jgi:hypothetical protein
MVLEPLASPPASSVSIKFDNDDSHPGVTRRAPNGPRLQRIEPVDRSGICAKCTMRDPHEKF